MVGKVLNRNRPGASFGAKNSFHWAAREILTSKRLTNLEKINLWLVVVLHQYASNGRTMNTYV